VMASDVFPQNEERNRTVRHPLPWARLLGVRGEAGTPMAGADCLRGQVRRHPGARRDRYLGAAASRQVSGSKSLTMAAAEGDLRDVSVSLIGFTLVE